jgi:hypothetical protein
MISDFRRFVDSMRDRSDRDRGRMSLHWLSIINCRRNRS